MGSDIEQLITDVEDCFGIAIDNEEAGKITTVGQLCDAVWDQVGQKEEMVCYFQVVFFRLRKFATENSKIRLPYFSTRLYISEVWNTEERKLLWEKMSRQLQLKIPEVSKWILMAKKDEIFSSNSIRQFVDKIIRMNFTQLQTEFGVNRKNVNTIIVDIIQEISEADRRRIIPAARFVNDLRFD